MKKTLPILLSISIILIYIILGTIFDGDHIPMIVILLSSIFGITIFYLNHIKSKSLMDAFVLILPFFLFFLISGFIVNDFSRIAQYLIFIPLSSLLAHFYNVSRIKLLLPFSILLYYFIGNYLFITIFTFINNNNSEKNIAFSKTSLLDSSGKEIILDNSKIIVLDFWSTSCGICFKKFPDLELTYNKYKNNDKVQVFAVNVPLDEDKFSKTVKILDSIGYKFPKLYAKSFEQIEKNLKFNTFPHLIILKNNRIRYDGMFETQKNTFIYSIESEIDKLLKE